MNLFKSSKGTFAKLITSSVGSQIIALASTPILLRIYGPAEFGRYSISLAVGAILAVALAGRLELAIALPQSAKRAHQVYATGHILVVLLGLLSAIIGVFGYVLHFWSIIPCIFGVIIGMLQSKFQLHIALLNRNLEFSRVAILRIIQAILTAGIQISIGVLLNFKHGLEIGCTASLLLSVFLASATFWDIRIFSSSISDHKRVLFRYRDFLKFDIWSALLNSISSQLPIILLSRYFSAESVGYYALANRISALPITLIGGNIAQVFYPFAAQRKRNRTENQWLPVQEVVILFALGTCFFAPQIWLAEPLIRFFFGDRWTPSATIILILMPWLLLVFSLSPFAGLFQIHGQQKIFLVSNIILIGMRVLAFVGCASFANSWISAIISYSIASVLYWIWLAQHLWPRKEICND